MKRFNLDETSANLKIKLKISQFYGEASFQRNANINRGTCIPVLRRNNNNEIYLHTMKWGINLFPTNKNNLTTIARSENISSTTTWSPLLSSSQKCIIICKGFYLWQATEILDTRNRRKILDRQPFYISPNKSCEGEFFYILGLYKQTRTYSGKSYQCVALSQSVSNHNKFIGYVERIPLIIHKNQINNWLFNNNNLLNIQNFIKNKIITNPFLKIGLWVNFPEEKDYRNENIILQSRFEWNLENEAKMIGFEDDDFNFEKVESDALKQNEINKNKNKKLLNNNNNNNIIINEEEEELKQEEQYSFNDSDNDKDNNINKKRQRNEFNNDTGDESNDENIIQPPNKKQKIIINGGDQLETEKNLQ